jgi:hypothetical protein
LHNARFVSNQIQRIATIQRKLLDGFLLHDVADGRVISLELFSATLDRHSFGNLAHLHNRVHSKRGVYLEGIICLLKFLKAGLFDDDGIVPSRKRREGVDARIICGLSLTYAGTFVQHRYGGSGDNRSLGIKYGAGNA